MFQLLNCLNVSNPLQQSSTQHSDVLDMLSQPLILHLWLIALGNLGKTFKRVIYNKYFAIFHFNWFK